MRRIWNWYLRRMMRKHVPYDEHASPFGADPAMLDGGSFWIIAAVSGEIEALVAMYFIGQGWKPLLFNSHDQAMEFVNSDSGQLLLAMSGERLELREFAATLDRTVIRSA